MKFVKMLIFLGTLVFLTASCFDVLDKAPDGNMQMEEVLSDPLKVEGLLNRCYEKISVKGYNYHWFDNLPVSMSDDAYSSEEGIGTPVAEMYQGNYSDNSHPVRDGGGGLQCNYWQNYWGQIRLCNQFLEIIDNAPVQKEENRGRFRAEAKVLRAFFYMELIKWFGEMPIITHSMSYDADCSVLKRVPVYECAKWLCEDLDEAIDEPNLPWRIDNWDDRMRMTKAVACALKTKLMLFAASPLFNRGENHWEEAFQVAKKSVEQLKANGYELFTKTTEPERFTGKAGALHELLSRKADYSPTPRDKETILQVRDGSTFIFGIAYTGCNMDNTVKVGQCPTVELVEAFETADGEPILDLERPYLDEFHMQPNYNPNAKYDPQNPFVNRDPRLDETVLRNGTVIQFNQENVVWSPYEGGPHAPTLNMGDTQRSRTGYYPYKLNVPGSGGRFGIFSSEWKYYRLGETLLDLAEAAAEAGHEADARAAANEVRHRSCMPSLPSGLSQKDLILRIRNERRVELAYEEQRYFDLRRWQKPDGDLSATCKYFVQQVVTKNADGTFSYSRKRLHEKERGGWENKNLLLPIPRSEAILLEQITGDKWQNPGW